MRIAIITALLACAGGCLAVNPYQGSILDVVDGRDEGVYDFVLDDTFVYFGTGAGGGSAGHPAGLSKCRKDGCTSHDKLYSYSGGSGGGGIVLLTQTANDLFWGEVNNDSDCWAQNLHWMPKNNGTNNPIPNVTAVGALIADDDGTIYWFDGGAGALKHCNVITDNCATPVSLVTVTDAPFRLAVDDTNIYWVEADGLHAAPKGSTQYPGSTLFSPSPSNVDVANNPGLAVDSDAVYWVGGTRRSPM